MLELKTNAKYNLAKASVNIRGGTNKSSTLHLPHCHLYTCLCKYETTPVFVAIKNIIIIKYFVVSMNVMISAFYFISNKLFDPPP